MNEHLTSGVVSLVLLILYLVIKDITIPLLRRRQNSHQISSNPGELKAVIAKYDAKWEEQGRVNERVDRNINRIFQRLDEGKSK